MKRSTKITSIIIIFFLIIATVIIGRQMIGMHFQKKFSKRPLPVIIVTTVEEQNFVNKIDSFGTATPNKTKSFNLQKHEILTSIDFNKKVKKGEIIAKLKSTNILAPFDGVVGKRDFSNDIKVSESSIVINIEDTSILFVDLDLPEIYVPVIKKQLPVEIRFSGYKEKIYMGQIESFASRINIDTRTLSTRIKFINENLLYKFATLTNEEAEEKKANFEKMQAEKEAAKAAAAAAKAKEEAEKKAAKENDKGITEN